MQDTMQDLVISLIQCDLFWEDRDRNLDAFKKRMNSISEVPDIIILPEMFNTGFSINPAACAETMDGKTMDFLASQAAKRNCMIIGSLMISEGSAFYNRLICMKPDSTFSHYDKRHLFRIADENKYLKPGNKRIIVEVKGWKIMPLVCYDLRFPVWSKNTFSAEAGFGYDLLVYVANWPQSRAHVWTTLLSARALENQVYVAGVNRTGKDGNGKEHTGDSRVIDPKGFVIAETEPGKESVMTATLSHTELKKVREKHPFGLDWDHFTIEL